jgi:nitroreductase
MEVLKAITQRRSIRKFKEGCPDEKPYHPPRELDEFLHVGKY